MVSDYKNADGDYRGVLERYLPTAYKTIGNGSDVHRGLLGALKQMLVTTEQDIIDGTQQVFLANANSWALDLYGDWVGESRKGELDDTYRARIIEKITLGRNTVGNIIVGIKREINDPDLTVSVYEPWRNIFILNKSFLNGADRLIGKFYRYAVVQVTLNKYVNALELQMIADKYKSAGISLVFVYREGIVAGDGALLALPLKLITENRNTVTRNRSQLQGTLLMNGLPTGTKATDLFTVNESDLNGADVLASDPNSVYRGVYGTVPSKNIFGTTAPTAGMTSDPYDFIFQQSKVDTSTLGGRNYILNSKHTLASQVDAMDTGWVDMSIPISALSNTVFTISVQVDYDNVTAVKDGSRIGAEVIALRIQPDGSAVTKYFGVWHSPKVGESFHGRVSTTYDMSGVALKSVYTPSHWGGGLYISSITATNVSVSNPKLEIGTFATDWTPAPEDIPKIYIHPYKGTDYTALNRLDGVTETVTTSGLPTVAFNISEYVKGVLQAKAFNNSTRYGRNLLLDSKTQTKIGAWYSPNSGWTEEWGTYLGSNIKRTSSAWDNVRYNYKDLLDRRVINTTDDFTYSVYFRVVGEDPIGMSYAKMYFFSLATTKEGPIPIQLTSLKEGQWTRLVVTFKFTDDLASDLKSSIRVEMSAAPKVSGARYEFAAPKLERGSIATEYTPAPEDNPTAVDYTNFSTPVSSININLKGSPFGLAPTTITVLSQGATPLTGKWYKNGTLISPQTTQVSDATTPTGTWSFKLDTPTLVSSVTLTDNYPDATGAYRVITMTTADNRELVILNTTQQVTGTINTLRLQTQTPEIYRPYIKSATIGNTTLSSPQVFDASTGNWVDVTKSTNLVPYIAYGDVTNALYVTLRNKTTQQNIDYLGLDITQVSVEGQ